MDTPWIIAGGLVAMIVAMTAVIGKLRSNSREFNRALWGQWRRG